LPKRWKNYKSAIATANDTQRSQGAPIVVNAAWAAMDESAKQAATRVWRIIILATS
jgi:hypothetical protein